MNFLYKQIFRYLLSVFIIFGATIYPQQDESWKIYDDSQIARVDITINPDTLQWIYDNVNSDIEHYATFHFQNAYINENVDSIGFRLRGNTSRDAKKKSFKVSFNTFIKGRDFYGVEKLNLNGEHNDPSIIRSKLCFDKFSEIGLTASRANHVEVYINGKYYGLYISVEHINDEFLKKNYANDSGNLWKCLYPADLNYLGADQNAYKSLTSDSRPVYELTTNETTGDFTKLVHFISVLNNTSESLLADSLESIINIPDVLKYFAMNILVGEWDDYWSLMNNYYLYYEPSEDIFHLIPYDYDNTFGVDWSGNNWVNANPYNYPKVVGGYRPLAERLMGNAQYRNLYTHFLEFYNNNVYQLSNWENRIDSLKQIITTSALNDTFRILDYGFTDNDFFNSYSASPYSNQQVKYGLKQFINLRNSSLPAQLNYQSAKPIVYKIDYEPKNPGANDTIFVYASAFDNDGLSDVSIYFQESDTSSTETFTMDFSPILNTKKVEESDRWIGKIPPLGEGKHSKFYVQVKDLQNQTQLYPRKNAIEIRTSQTVVSDIVINEFMADNTNTITDPEGDYDDWVELFNSGSTAILLTGKYLTDKPDNLIKYKIIEPNVYINANEYLLVWCDEDSSDQGIHTNFKLSKSGEYIAIVDTDGVSIIDSITFGVQTTDVSFGRQPDASPNWAFMNPTPEYSNNITSVDKENILPENFTLSAYPNPFNPSTTIHYSISKSSDVKIEIFDLLGGLIWQKDEGKKNNGQYELTWDGVNNSGTKISSGIYLLRVKADMDFNYFKLILLK